MYAHIKAIHVDSYIKHAHRFLCRPVNAGDAAAGTEVMISGCFSVPQFVLTHTCKYLWVNNGIP